MRRVVGGGFDRRLRTWCRASIVCILLAGTAAPTPAQPLTFTGINGDLGFETNFENEELSQPSSRQHLDRRYFEERLDLHTAGFAYDPALARFTLGGQIGLFQDAVNTTTNGTGTTLTGDGVLTGYDARLSLLNDTAYGLDVFGQRSQSNTRQDFAGNIKTDINDYGAFWRLQNIPFPSYFSFQQNEVKQHFTLLPVGLQQDETRRTATYTGERRTATDTLSADYRFDDVDDRARPNGAYQIHDGGLLDVRRFGADLDDYLSSSARALRRDGVASNTTLLGHAGVHLQHTPSLISDYAYNVAYLQQSGAGTQVSNNGSAGLAYQLYKSLNSSLNGNAGYTDLAPGHDLTYGTTGSLAYRKALPWSGAFVGGGGVAYQLDDRRTPAGTVSIIDEAQTFNAVDEVTLKNPNVITATIVVTDVGKTITYAAGIDYTLEERGPVTVLHRVIFGGIAPGQAVLVSYSFSGGAELKVASYPFSFNAGLDFDWLYLFYAGDRLRQSVLTGSSSDTLGPIDTDTFGTQVRWRYGGGEAVLLNEYSTYDANDLRYRSLDFTQSGSAAVRRDVTAALNSIESFTDFTEPRRNRTFVTPRANLSWRPLYTLFLDGFTGFRYQRETGIPRDQLFEFGVRGQWTFGAFVLSLSYDHAVQDVGSSGRIGDLVRFDMVRHF